MKLLAIETSSNACSVALELNGEIIDKHVVAPREHTRILLPMITELLADAGIVTTDLDAVLLGNGPGSFIGMRIGASVAQGICFAAGLNVIPVSSLAVVAAEVMSGSDARHVVVTQDARMSEVYVGLFERDGSGLPVAVSDEFICPVDGFEIDGEPYHAAGEGWNRYPELRAKAGKNALSFVDAGFPRARFLLALSETTMATAIPPDRLVPAYLRHKVAEKPGQNP